MASSLLGIGRVLGRVLPVAGSLGCDVNVGKDKKTSQQRDPHKPDHIEGGTIHTFLNASLCSKPA